jgi:hypothetical protein
MLHKVGYFKDNPPSNAKLSFLADEVIPSLSFPIENSAVKLVAKGRYQRDLRKRIRTFSWFSSRDFRSLSVSEKRLS